MRAREENVITQKLVKVPPKQSEDDEDKKEELATGSVVFFVRWWEMLLIEATVMEASFLPGKAGGLFSGISGDPSYQVSVRICNKDMQYIVDKEIKDIDDDFKCCVAMKDLVGKEESDISEKVAIGRKLEVWYHTRQDNTITDSAFKIVVYFQKLWFLLLCFLFLPHPGEGDREEVCFGQTLSRESWYRIFSSPSLYPSLLLPSFVLRAISLNNEVSLLESYILFLDSALPPFS